MMKGFNLLFFLVKAFCIFGQTSYRQGAVSAAHPLAVEAGVEILKKGGNAVDAAVAVHFALAAVYQIAGNIAGGGFAMIHNGTGEVLALDFREVAPLKSSDSMYLDNNGIAITTNSLEGASSVGIPGSVAGMKALHDSLGVMAWDDCLQPALKLAKSHRLTSFMASQWIKYSDDIRRVNGLLPPFLSQKDILQEGSIIEQTELAELIISLARYGSNYFYKGNFAQEMVSFLQSKGGVHTVSDFEAYQPLWRKPQRITYNGYTIYTMSLPSAGGIGLHQFFKMAEFLEFGKLNPYSVKYAHYFAEMAMRVYADRHRFLGDPLGVSLSDITRIQSSDYLHNLSNGINATKRTDASVLGTAQSRGIESFQTTHYCTADSSGLLVSVTTTLNSYFGSKLYYKGMFFNNEMDDFSTVPGHSNQFGLPYSEINKVRPGYRMLSSMSPVILLKGNKPIAALGTPGGSTIITNIFQVIDLITRGWTLEEAIDQKKLHTQWKPDELVAERGALSEKTQKRLLRMGYKIRSIDQIGMFNAIEILSDGKMKPVADPKRRGDTATGGI